MLERPSNAWPTTDEAENIMFFAQCFHGFLDQNSFEGFRAYSLDTVGRLKELIAVCEDVIRGRMKDAVLPPVLDEMIWSISNDEAVLTLAPGYAELLIQSKKNQKLSPHDIQYTCKAVLRRVESKYKNKLIDGIVKYLGECKKTNLLTTAGYLASHLLGRGYDRDYLLERVNEEFFAKDVAGITTPKVKAFLESFNDVGSRFNVVLRINEALERVLRISDIWKFAELSDLPDHVQVAMREAPDLDPNKDRFGIAEVVACDPYRAIIKVYEYLDDAKSLTLLQVGEVPATWSDDSYIFSAGSDVGEVYTTENSPIPGRRADARLTARMIRNTETLAKNLETHFDVESKERIRRALATAGTVIDTHQDEVRLISLWSSLEVLLGDPPDLNSRISHFLRHLVPLIVVRYHRRMFVVMYEQFMVQYGKSFQKLMRSATHSMDGTLHTKFAQLLLLPEQEENRKLLMSLCADNPLLRHRVWRLYKQYSTPKDALASMRGHADRVQWQLNRVYRVRNMLVHSGRAPTVLDTLVHNCVEYLRAAVINIVRVGARNPFPSVLDEVIAEVSFDWTILCQALEGRKADSFDKALVQAIFKAL